ncbi:hypothetical protein PN419_10215 [Halorubrum ezzemoulense]|uniref:hypothetical protein n=1 Tax=Halorubrum ezzemoulense TaxID=337243 RepID=UPI00232D56C4|nr:hypothetical protein [Halorubrum ezzemoulense]MDB9249368.1 hypothetical protein [Halorubrum ezzemoulense]MDB9257588.1 hypothetical protein [Halorubrum ezzemoulense]MDB9262049.1 hypothetical protein [Halorubrum ezzemoulense]MDB9265552.1 hypothetical protein [Halorubrum ezzemoulense]MDB9267949.1 hypothetical protein [Halorubrum ezzemoulense]
MASRRSVLIGLGSLVAGGGALLGTGAFTTVTAERTVNVQTAGDGSAFLGLTAARAGGDFVDTTGDTISIELGTNSAGNGTGLNENAITTFRNLVTVTNNGTQDITALNLTMGVSGNSVTADNTFEFTVSPSDGNGSQGVISNGGNILTSDGAGGTLAPGSSVNFGILIDLIDGGDTNGDLPSSLTYTLTIEALTGNSDPSSNSTTS